MFGACVSVMMFPVMQLLDGYLIWDPDNNRGKGVRYYNATCAQTGIPTITGARG